MMHLLDAPAALEAFQTFHAALGALKKTTVLTRAKTPVHLDSSERILDTMRVLTLVGRAVVPDVCVFELTLRFEREAQNVRGSCWLVCEFSATPRKVLHFLSPAHAAEQIDVHFGRVQTRSGRTRTHIQRPDYPISALTPVKALFS